VLSLAANFVLAPLVALVLWRVLGLDEPLGIGLLLCGLAAGAPFLIKLAEFAKADLAFAVGLMVLLMVVTVGYLPLALPFVLEGITVNPVKIARSLIVLMLIPLAVGLLVRARRPGAASRIRPTVGWISNISVILVVVLTMAGHFKSVLSVRYLRRPGRRRVHGGLRRYRVAAWRTRKEHSGGAGSGDGAEKRRRCIRGRRAELR
jgi:bile acid:Na+ symporter, BASS family